MTTPLEHIGHVETVQGWYGSRRAEFIARVIYAWENGDVQELVYLREVRGI